VDIVEFHRSFFTLNLDLWLNFHTNLANFLHPAETSDTDGEFLKMTRKLDKLFVGFKSAPDYIDSCRIQHSGVDIGSTMQNLSSLESYLYNQMCRRRRTSIHSIRYTRRFSKRLRVSAEHRSLTID
jgi:hypothetical protein